MHIQEDFPFSLACPAAAAGEVMGEGGLFWQERRSCSLMRAEMHRSAQLRMTAASLFSGATVETYKGHTHV